MADLSDLVIDNFQSVKNAHLKLGGLTVVTGPTGSGKSGTLRAFRLAAFNKRGSSFIRQGASLCTVGFGSQGEGWFLAIDRGPRGKDAYRIATPSKLLDGFPEAPDGGVDVQTFTKLAGEAPPEVLALHRLTALNFVGQFDSPFLLSASGSEVARVLGELTNVTLIYEAAREGARRRQRIAGDLKRAEAEAASLAEQVQQYAGLPARIAAQVRAEQALISAGSAQHAVGRLAKLIAAVHEAGRRVVEAQVQVQRAEPPSLDAAEALLQRHQRLSALISQVRSAREEQYRQKELQVAAEAYEQHAHRELHDVLVETGTCPTCGQEIPR